MPRAFLERDLEVLGYGETKEERFDGWSIFSGVASAGIERVEAAFLYLKAEPDERLDDELLQLLTYKGDSETRRINVVRAAAGVGKTTLARQLARMLRLGMSF